MQIGIKMKVLATISKLVSILAFIFFFDGCHRSQSSDEARAEDLVVEMQDKAEDFAVRASNVKEHISLARPHQRKVLQDDLKKLDGEQQDFIAMVRELNEKKKADDLGSKLTAASEKIDQDLSSLEHHFKR